MLLSLHVKNLALIEEEEINFTEGLNILTGETGAGKSIIIGSINLALGAKADKGLIRNGADYALIEVVFRLDNGRQVQKLKEMGIEPDEEGDESEDADHDIISHQEEKHYGTILIKRKIYPGRSQCSVQGESVTTKELRDLGETLIDVYGQRENGRLLRRQAQLSVIDEFAGEEDAKLLSEVQTHYRNWNAGKKEYESDDLDESARKREIDLLTYEVNEIETADIKDGEDEELETEYRKLSSFRKISEALQAADQLLEGGGSGLSAGNSAGFGGSYGDGNYGSGSAGIIGGSMSGGGSGESAADQIGRADRILTGVQGIDMELDAVIGQVADLDAQVSDACRAIADYIEGMTFDPQEFQEIESRLDLINHLKDKYGAPGGTIANIQKALASRKKRLEDLSDYDALREKLAKEIRAEHEALLSSCRKLSAVRHRAAEEFRMKMTEQLRDLNFNQVDFRVEFAGEDADPAGMPGKTDSEKEEEKNLPDNRITSSGFDDVRFFISMNPGEPPRPLEDVASGGELSRIMLAMKTVFAGKDDINTFIFDEIDTGISGQTAWKVAVKMGRLAAEDAADNSGNSGDAGNTSGNQDGQNDDRQIDHQQIDHQQMDHRQIICITHLPQIAAMGRTHFLIEKMTDGQRTATHIRRLGEEESVAELARMMGGAEVTEATLQSARDLKQAAAAETGR